MATRIYEDTSPPAAVADQISRLGALSGFCAALVALTKENEARAFA